MSAHIEIESIPDGHVIVGYFVSLKVLDEDGSMYFASRNDGLNMMEAWGMAKNLEMIAEASIAATTEDPRDP